MRLALIICCFLSVFTFCGAKGVKYTIPPLSNQKHVVWEAGERDKIAYSLAEKYQLSFLGRGCFMVRTQSIAIFGLHFCSRQKETIESVRPMLYKMLRDYWDFLSKNPAYMNYVAKSSEKDKRLKPAMMGIRLAFWDENVDRPLYPYLALVVVGENKVFYYYADPKTQALGEPIVERFEDNPELRYFIDSCDWPSPFKKGPRS